MVRPFNKVVNLLSFPGSGLSGGERPRPPCTSGFRNWMDKLLRHPAAGQPDACIGSGL